MLGNLLQEGIMGTLVMVLEVQGMDCLSHQVIKQAWYKKFDWVLIILCSVITPVRIVLLRRTV